MFALQIHAQLNLKQKKELMHLWNSSYPEEICYAKMSDFQNYLDGLIQCEHLMLVDAENHICGWLFLFLRDNITQFGMMVRPELKGRGIGKTLLSAAKKRANSLTGWIITEKTYRLPSGGAYTSPKQFYIKQGFKLLEHEKLRNAPIQAVQIKWEIT